MGTGVADPSVKGSLSLGGGGQRVTTPGGAQLQNCHFLTPSLISAP